jgi:hypothetical protein
VTKTVIDLRNAIFDRLTAVGFSYSYATARKAPLPTLQADQLPALGVYVLDGDATPDGDGNVGELRFVDDDTIAISVVRGGAMPAALEVDMAVEYLAIQAALFCDATFTAFGPDALFESIPRQRRRWLFPAQGDEYRIELRYEITFRRRTRFEPVITDDFKEADLIVRQAGSDPDAPALQVKIIEAQ